MRPRLLDLFCGAGGAAVGYHRAGFDVVGVDIARQSNYPFEFHQGDAVQFAYEHGHRFDATTASPPCQVHSDLASVAGEDHADLIPQTREVLTALHRAYGIPYVIENVEGAPLLDPVTLCGSMFGLGVAGFTLKRHRLFESSVPFTVPPDVCAGRQIVGVYGDGGGWTQRGGAEQRPTYRGGVKLAVGPARIAMGIDWTNRRELSQAIPPAYTEHLGRQLAAHLTNGQVHA